MGADESCVNALQDFEFLALAGPAIENNRQRQRKEKSQAKIPASSRVRAADKSG